MPTPDNGAAALQTPPAKTNVENNSAMTPTPLHTAEDIIASEPSVVLSKFDLLNK